LTLDNLEDWSELLWLNGAR